MKWQRHLWRGPRIGAGGPARSDKLVESDREIAHTFARCVENCVCYGGGDTDDSNLADSARAEIRHVRIGFVYEIDIEFRRRVGVHSDMVFGKIRINNAADIWIGNCRFHQSRAETKQHPAQDLAPRQAWINHAAHVIDAYRALDPHLSKRIDLHFEKTAP